MKLSENLKWRGLIKDKTFDSDEWLDTPRTFYWGFDASSDSLTIGNLAAALLARRFIDAGWKAVLLAGGATSLVGDPGGKDSERELKDAGEIAANIKAVSAQVAKLFEGKPHEVVNNLDWLGDVKFLDFLRDTGKFYPMSELMQRDFVSTRMGEGGAGISYAEFSYSLLQGYDFWWLFKNKGVELQIGASDQWGNMISGVPLVRKKEGKEVHAMSMPLVINKSTGVKFGKSEAGAVWLDPAKTSPTDFYQFFINTSDEDVEEYLKVFTMLDKEAITAVMALQRQNPSERSAQKLLAEEVTKLVHGQGSGDKAGEITEFLTSSTPISDATDAQLVQIRKQIASATSAPNGSVIEALVASGLASSLGDGRRLMASGAVYINGQRAKAENFDPSDFTNGRLLLRRGKAFKDSALIELQ